MGLWESSLNGFGVKYIKVILNIKTDFYMYDVSHYGKLIFKRETE
jgi:hypothetical protein